MDFIDDPLPLDASGEKRNGRAQHNQESADNLYLVDGVPLSEAEITRLFNSIMDFEIPPEIRDRTWTDREIAEAESPSHLMEDPPYGFRFPDQIELNACGIYETMYDTLPEMDIILENECIL